MDSKMLKQLFLGMNLLENEDYIPSDLGQVLFEH